jgi:hypothetical protein
MFMWRSAHLSIEIARPAVSASIDVAALAEIQLPDARSSHRRQRMPATVAGFRVAA